MSEAFGWIGKILDTILMFVPRLWIMEATHEGVAFVRGKNPKRMEKGLHWWWPFWTKIVSYPVVRQTQNLPQQTITTADDKQLQINTIVVFEVTDILKALTLQWDLEDTIMDLSQAAVRKALVKCDYDYIITETDKLEKLLTSSVRRQVTDFGVNIIKVCITDCVKTHTFTIAALGTIGGNAKEFLSE